METPDDYSPVIVFSGTMWEAGMVKSLLENAEIEAFLKDEIRGTYAPWNVAPGGVGAVKVVVSNMDFEKAKLIVDEYEKNQRSNEKYPPS